MQRSILFALAAALTLAMAAPASAQPFAHHARVSYQGIDTATPAGADMLLHRIRAAARDVCDFRSGPRPLVERDRVNQCMRNVMDRTVSDLHMPTVTASYEGQDRTWLFASR